MGGIFLIFIGPRLTWGPIYGSGCEWVKEWVTYLKLVWHFLTNLYRTQVNLGSDLWVRLWVREVVVKLIKLTWLWLMEIQTQCQLIIPIGNSKTMWQWKRLNLVANFGSNASDATWWLNFEPICNKSKNKYLNEIQTSFEEISQLWSWEIQNHLKQDLAVKESRPCWHVSWF